MHDALGVGALNIDLIYEVGDLIFDGRRFDMGDEISGERGQFESILEELKVKGKLIARSAGGSAANTINAMSHMGMRTAFLGTTGTDEEGDFLLRQMAGTDLSRVRRAGRSGICVSMVAGDDRTMIVLPNANDLLSIGTEDLDVANDSRLVHLTSFVGDAALKEQVKLAMALNDEVMMSFDPGAKYVSRGLDEMLPLLRRTDILFANEKEISKLTGMGPVQGCRHLIELGPDIVVLKRGGKGSTIFADDEEIGIPAVPVDVMDATGAGDVYAGAFLTGLLKGWGLKKCGRFGAEAAASSIARPGREGYPDRVMLADFSRRKS